jgi:predicted Abi (CAAX) family protease
MQVIVHLLVGNTPYRSVMVLVTGYNVVSHGCYTLLHAICGVCSVVTWAHVQVMWSVTLVHGA